MEVMVLPSSGSGLRELLLAPTPGTGALLMVTGGFSSCLSFCLSGTRRQILGEGSPCRWRRHQVTGQGAGLVCHGQFPSEAWRAWAGVPGGSGAWLTLMTSWALRGRPNPSPVALRNLRSNPNISIHKNKGAANIFGGTCPFGSKP